LRSLIEQWLLRLTLRNMCCCCASEFYACVSVCVRREFNWTCAITVLALKPS
jgi:hypothetical protein